MNMLTTILSFLVTLGVLVIVHEYGHFQVARWCGVKVLRFSVGFGRVIWRRQSSTSATEFTLSALPLGGYVRMLDSREAPVAPDELRQAFDQQPLSRRVAIVSAGPIANLLLAVLLYAAMHWVGLEEPKALLSTPASGSLADQAGLRAGDWVQAVSKDDETAWQEVASLNELRWEITQAVLHGEALRLQVTDSEGARRHVSVLPLNKLAGSEVDAEAFLRIGLGGPFREPVMGEVREGGPAAAAGLRSGDRVQAVDDVPVPDAQWLFHRIRTHVSGDTPMNWRVLRAGQVVELSVQPRVIDEAGQRAGRIDAYIGAAPKMVTVRHGPLEGLAQGVSSEPGAWRR